MWSNTFIVVNVIHSSIWISMCHLSHNRNRKRRSRSTWRNDWNWNVKYETFATSFCTNNDVLVQAELHERMKEWMNEWLAGLMNGCDNNNHNKLPTHSRSRARFCHPKEENCDSARAHQLDAAQIIIVIANSLWLICSSMVITCRLQ